MQEAVQSTPRDTLQHMVVLVTFYTCPPFCGTMASGATVYEGAAACGYAWDLGTRFTLEGDPTARVYVCEDRGLGPWLWIDIFFQDEAAGYAWLASVGTLTTARLQP